MCGIIAYKGPENGSKIALEGLKNLEYRGYDSWGLGYINKQGALETDKHVGAIGEITLKKLKNKSQVNTIIAHTRWATTGRVSQLNAHPHISQNKTFAVVHNGIVENYEELAQKLKKNGYTMRSQTDTEVIANYIDYEYGKQKDFKAAVSATFNHIRGRNGIVALCQETGELIAARNGSPLIVGVNSGEYFIASDVPAFLKYTNKVIYLDDGQMVHLYDKKGSPVATFFNIDTCKPITRRIVEVQFTSEKAEKGAYKHFMIKEIMEQKETLRRAVNQKDEDIRKIAQKIKNAYGTFSVACGTAGYASMIGEHLFSKIAQKHINFAVASEFASYEPFLKQRTLMLVTSQSGETADVLEAMETARRKKVKIVSLVNVSGSSIAKKSDYTFYINAGPEKAVASTKAATSQIALHTLLAYATAGKLRQGKQELVNAAGQVNDMLNPRYENHILRLAKKLKNTHDLYVIGRGLMYPVALEIALKIKEVSYVHADGLPGGELKHGTIALISKGTPCIAVVAKDENEEAILSNAAEIKARGGYIIGIAPEKKPVFDYFIRVPNAGVAAPIVSIIPGQILAYHLAVLRGYNPDKPRNLAKSVTVK